MSVPLRFVWIQDAADHWTLRIEPEDYAPVPRPADVSPVPPAEEITPEQLRQLLGDVALDSNVRLDAEGGFRVVSTQTRSPAANRDPEARPSRPRRRTERSSRGSLARRRISWRLHHDRSP